jgi:uncharacterized protein DUF262
MLAKEIEHAKRLVKTDAYQMSVGELVNMYKAGALIINPDFQRLFRWELGQKSKLIESILLGIPLPSIFVFEKEDAKWELNRWTPARLVPCSNLWVSCVTRPPMNLSRRPRLLPQSICRL